MSKLKKCPFCGGLTQLGSFLIGCLTCKISFPFHPKNKEAMNEAVKKWNKRVGDN